MKDKTWTGISRVLAVIGTASMFLLIMLVLFGIPIAYYWLEEEPREAAITAFDNGNTAKIQLVLEDKHTEATGDGFDVRNKYFMTFNQNGIRKTLEVNKRLYDNYLIGETVAAEIPNVKADDFLFIDGALIKTDTDGWGVEREHEA